MPDAWRISGTATHSTDALRGRRSCQRPHRTAMNSSAPQARRRAPPCRRVRRGDHPSLLVRALRGPAADLPIRSVHARPRTPPSPSSSWTATSTSCRGRSAWARAIAPAQKANLPPDADALVQLRQLPTRIRSAPTLHSTVRSSSRSLAADRRSSSSSLRYSGPCMMRSPRRTASCCSAESARRPGGPL